jgi:hypothetical protein
LNPLDVLAELAGGGDGHAGNHARAPAEAAHA